VITLDRTTVEPRIGRMPMIPNTAPIRPGSTTPNRRRQTQDAHARVCADRRGRPHIMSAEIFRGVLIRERKRADRSAERFMLLLVDLSGVVTAAGAGSSVIRNAAIDAVALAKRETDVMGWFEGQSVIGLILPQIGSFNASTAGELELRVRGELAKRLEPAVVSRIAIKVHVHSEAKEATGAAFEPVDPLLGELRSRKEGASLNEAVKRGLDVLGSLALLILLSPLMLLIAALVKATSRGPVFFRQVRIGQCAKPFTMLKFRSMRPGAGHAIHQDYVTWFINSSGKQQAGADKGVFKITNDPRITGIGRILRNTSLDELPQFLNVLMGEMSLVGPRPPLPYEVEQYKSWHCRRVLEAKPGITGLWQVTGRSRTTFDEMVRLDLRYARSYSLWLDIKILLATPRAVISGKGAC
jgi:lipopolysaccharide/colanic/teichoic acid biosynthesis glycosyltransferase